MVMLPLSPVEWTGVEYIDVSLTPYLSFLSVEILFTIICPKGLSWQLVTFHCMACYLFCFHVMSFLTIVHRVMIAQSAK